MRFRLWVLAIVFCVLGTFSLYLFTDWLSPARIQIIVQNRAALAAARRALSPVSFVLNGKYRLTRVCVIPLIANNHSAPRPEPVWQLTSTSNSLPVHGFLYGQKLRGMKPDPTARAEPLAPDTTYRLRVEAGRARGQVDFHTPPVVN